MGKESGGRLSNAQLYKVLWNESEKLNESNPDELQQKLTYYGRLYELTGKFHAAAVADAELKKFERMSRESNIILSKGFKTRKDATKYTVKEQDAKLFLATKEFHQEERKFRNEALRWENARDSILEQINIMKRKQDVQINLFARANSLNGR